MSDLSLKLHDLREKLESAAFLVGRGDSEKQVHSEIIQSLILVSEIESAISSRTLVQPVTEADSHEAGKVRRRLKLWSGRPNQINSKILNAYLKLKRSGVSIITEQMIKDELPGEVNFDSNFTQMKIIAEKNHGKIFEQYGDQVSIWPPIFQDIVEYERVVLEGGYLQDDDLTIRELAKSWLKKHYPDEVSGKFRASKYFPERDIWFFTFPVDYFDTSKSGFLRILLQHENDSYDFHYLKVPYSFFRDNKDRLNVRKSGDKFDLHISGKKSNWLECERSHGVSFREFSKA